MTRWEPEERRRQIEALLASAGWEADAAREVAGDAVESGAPFLESLCFQTLAEHVLARIHDASWVVHRAEDPDSEPHGLIRRLLASGASPADLALFARVMQREYLGDLACLLDGTGIYGTPRLPFEDFRVFAVDDDGQPIVGIDGLHETLGFQDLETEMRLSRAAADSG